MKKYFFSIFLLTFLGVLMYSLSEANAKKQGTVVAKSFYDLSIPTLDGKGVIRMKDFKGKYVLCVNVASECGYTRQYEGLQKLYSQYKDKLVVIGFPCNQFMGQEPGSATEIATFCKKNYGVTFLLSQKIDVKGSSQNEIHRWLTSKEMNGVSDATIKWNFNKIFIGPDGQWLKYFGSSTEPMSADITSLLK